MEILILFYIHVYQWRETSPSWEKHQCFNDQGRDSQPTACGACILFPTVFSHEGLLDLGREVSKWLWLNVKTVFFPTQFFMTVSYTHGRKYDNLTNCSHAIMFWAQIK